MKINVYYETRLEIQRSKSEQMMMTTGEAIALIVIRYQGESPMGLGSDFDPCH